MSMYRLMVTLWVLVSISVMANTFYLDKTHSSVGFRIGYMMVGKVTGSFSDMSGQLITNKDNQITQITGTIGVNSLTTHNDKRDKHLKSSDFFHTALYPSMKFNSKQVEYTDNGTIVVGDLTIHGITRRVSFPIEVSDVIIDNNLVERLGVSGKLTIDRKSFGILYSKKMDNGRLIIDNFVTIHLDIQATRE